MLQYDSIDVLKGIDASKDCDIGHYWYFLSKNLITNHVFAMADMI